MATELGNVWAACGIDSEWRVLQAVLLHRPGREMRASSNPNAVQMLAAVDEARAGAEHDAMARAYREGQPGGSAKVQEFYEQHGIECVTVAASELVKAAGGFGCLTGVLQRERA
jgi:arginine deiminase